MMSKKKIAYIIFVIFMTFHEVSEVINGGHSSDTFSIFNFTDNTDCNPAQCEIPDCMKDVPDCDEGVNIGKALSAINLISKGFTDY